MSGPGQRAAGKADAPTKLRAHRATMDAISSDRCRAFDLVVMVYLTKNMDGARCCRRPARSMCEDLGACRSSIFASLARLKRARLVERRQDGAILVMP